MPAAHTTTQFAEELPRLLSERQLTLREVARGIGKSDHAHLSRMLRGERAVSPEYVAQIEQYLGLSPGYFPEVRQARVIEAVQGDPVLRDEIYFDRVEPLAPRR